MSKLFLDLFKSSIFKVVYIILLLPSLVCYPLCEFAQVRWSLITETTHVHTRYSWWIDGSIGCYVVGVASGLLHLCSHNIVQISVATLVVLEFFHLECSQWIGGGSLFFSREHEPTSDMLPTVTYFGHV